jgi:hypothetical protein
VGYATVLMRRGSPGTRIEPRWWEKRAGAAATCQISAGAPGKGWKPEARPSAREHRQTPGSPPTHTWSRLGVMQPPSKFVLGRDRCTPESGRRAGDMASASGQTSAVTWSPGKQSDDRVTAPSALPRSTRRAVTPFQGQKQFQCPKREDCRQE